MTKVKVKKLNHKVEKTNPFELRFNKIKHKIVNKKLHRSELGSNAYQSRNKAVELRKKSLLVEYKNRNRTGSIKFVNKSKDDEKSRNQEKNKKSHKGNAEYMAEMFEKKRLAQLEREKTDNLKEKLDDQWNKLKSSFLYKEMARKELDDNKKIDSYDLILKDLLINSNQHVSNSSIKKD